VYFATGTPARSRTLQYLVTRRFSALHTAANFGRTEILSFLLATSAFDINQTNENDAETPLYQAMRGRNNGKGATGSRVNNSLEISRLLLENGADPNKGKGRDNLECADFPLLLAVRCHNTAHVRLLFEYGADPNHDNTKIDQQEAFVPRVIRGGQAEILDMLIQHGAIVVSRHYHPSLYELLCNEDKSRETKLAVCRVLTNHAAARLDDQQMALRIQSAVEYAIGHYDDVTERVTLTRVCGILFEAGMVPSSRAFYMPIREGNEFVANLLLGHGVDPFVREEEEKEEDNEDDHNDNNGNDISRSFSPFHAAARKEDVTMLRVLMHHWHERFLASGGKNGNGDSAIQVLCRFPHVYIQAIKLLVQEFHANVTEAATSEQHGGLLPFHSAVLLSPDLVSLDVVFFLLRLYPDALTTRNY
jgi:Ankyrin repeats (3 copies)